jgi:DNA-binding CsgD family transcriptional regulator
VLRRPGSGLRGRQSECETLDQLLEAARGGQSGVLVLRGEAGVGKTALLEYLADRASDCRVLRATGVESEMELAFAGAQLCCAPILDRIENLPDPQRDALATTFGLSAGPPPDRFMVGMAVLGLFADAAEQDVLICIVEDAQWLDRASAQTLSFVARRLLAERIALVLAIRDPSDEQEFRGLPELVVRGLSDAAARALLDSTIRRPVDPPVVERILAEARGNPLALLELPTVSTSADLASGVGPPDPMPLADRMEGQYVRELKSLEEETRRVLLTAAAEPVGDANVFWQALEKLGIKEDRAADAEATGLIDLGPPIRFRHPLVRSAAYGSAQFSARHSVHRALAQVIDAESDPDRHAWHRALGSQRPDEDVAVELERSADRALARGGLAAAAAFLERAAMLSPEPTSRAERRLRAANAQRDAGDLDAALGLLAEVGAGPNDALRTAQVERLRGLVAYDRQRSDDAARLLAHAARALEPFDVVAARATHLAALAAAMWASGPDTAGGVREAAEAALAAPRPPGPPRPADLALDALARRFTEGYVSAAPALARALQAVRDGVAGPDDKDRALWVVGNRAAGIIAYELWDFDSAQALAERQVQLARDAGALVQLQFALNFLGSTYLLAGDLTAASQVIEEDNLIAEATRNRPIAYLPVWLAALRGQDAYASELIDTASAGFTARGQHRMVDYANYYRAVLCNGLGRYDEALDAVRPALARDPIGFGPHAISELAEAASRTGEIELVSAALEWWSERTAATPTDWALGMEARVRALQGTGDPADEAYQQSVDHLSRTRLRAELARSHLLYGEWLRREGRRVDARNQLRIAHEMLDAMGLVGFAERARSELVATGETVRKRSVETRNELTPQEAQIARLADEGLTNPQIGSRLFISPRTVEWHLRKVYTKLGISSRRELRASLPELGLGTTPASPTR